MAANTPAVAMAPAPGVEIITENAVRAYAHAECAG